MRMPVVYMGGDTHLPGSHQAGRKGIKGILETDGATHWHAPDKPEVV
jgi:hypothetical protein